MAGASRNRSFPSNMRNFGATPPVQAQRSTFNLSKTWKGTFDGGQLIPFYVSEGLPGDTRKVRVSALARLATPIKPVMDNLYLDFHFWWVPNRQVWDNWPKLMGEQINPGDSTDYLVPSLAIGSDITADSIGDHMGLAIGVIGINYINALPFRSYNAIWHHMYRDQNLQNAPALNTGDGPDTYTDYPIRRRGKRHDYLTAALPFQQKGDPVRVNLGDSAPIIGNGSPTFDNGSSTAYGRLESYDATANVGLESNSAQQGFLSWDNPALLADLANGTGITVTDLRQSIAVQHVLERDARSGTRYPEILMSRFRVFDPQMLVLQRPEYLGGGTQAISIAPVPSTVPGDPTTTDPQGNLAAVGTAMVSGIGFTRSFTEHGHILGVVSARADLTYQKNIERMWSRRARFDYFHPELAHLSEQAIKNKEIYADGSAADDEVWGYIGAYDEYRYGQSLITGRFRSSHPQSLDVWHLSQEFSGRPTLNSTFIEDNPPIDRVIAVQDEPHFIMDCWISDIAARPMPLSGIPGLSRI